MTMNRLVRPSLTAAALYATLFAVPAHAQQQGSEAVASAAPLESPITLDGRLDEAAW